MKIFCTSSTEMYFQVKTVIADGCEFSVQVGLTMFPSAKNIVQIIHPVAVVALCFPRGRNKRPEVFLVEYEVSAETVPEE